MGEMIASSEENRVGGVEHCRKLETQKMNDRFDSKVEKGINVGVEVSVQASGQEDDGSKGMWREFTRDEPTGCVAQRRIRTVARAHERVNEFSKCGERVIPIIHARESERREVSEPLPQQETRPTRGNIKG